MGTKTITIIIATAAVWGAALYSMPRDEAATSADDDATGALAATPAPAAPIATRSLKPAAPEQAQPEPAPEEDTVPIAQLPAQPSAPTPAVDRSQVTVHAMRMRWKEGEPDPAWEADVVTFLDAEIDRLDLDLQSKEISCRGALCRLVLKFGDSSSAQKLYGVRQMDEVQSVTDVRSDRDGGIEVTIFSTRRGVSLEDVASGKV